MKVQCESCGVKLTLPDDKLAPGTDFSFNCPKCKHKNTVAIPDEGGGKPAAQSHAQADKGKAPHKEGAFDPVEDADLLEDFFEEGARPVLICFDDGPERDQIAQTLEQMDYVPVIPTSTRDALKRLQVTQFHMILLDENYDGQSLDRNALLRLIQPMEMPMRRRMWVALFGQNFQTFDYMTAYALSVNAVVSKDDLGRLEKVIERGMAEYLRFYKVYFEAMQELGKI